MTNKRIGFKGNFQLVCLRRSQITISQILLIVSKFLSVTSQPCFDSREVSDERWNVAFDYCCVSLNNVFGQNFSLVVLISNWRVERLWKSYHVLVKVNHNERTWRDERSLHH